MIARVSDIAPQNAIPRTPRRLLVVIGDSMLMHATPELTTAFRQANSDMQIINLSVGGSALTHNGFGDWVQSAPGIAASMKRGDQVVINLSHNDFYAMGQRAGWDNSFLQNHEYMDRATYLQRFEQLVRTFQDRGIGVHVVGPAPYLRPDPGASPFLARHHRAAAERIPELSNELQNLSRRLNVNYIPMLDNPALRLRSSRISDGLHPSEEGRQLMATQIASGVTSLRLHHSPQSPVRDQNWAAALFRPQA